MSKTSSLTGLLFICLGIFGCSDKLTESKAESIIKGKIHFPLTNSVSIQYGLMAFDKDSLPRYYYILQEKGMFKIENLGKGGFLVINNRFRVTPTDEARKFLVEEDKSPLKQGDSGEFMFNSRFKTSETIFEKINDIHEIPSMNAADVHYLVKLTNFTPFWSYYQDQSHATPDSIGKRTFVMIKTNEGWTARQ